MSRARALPSCEELLFARACAVPPAGLVALEDYARAAAQAEAAEAVPDPDDPSLVRGVHVCRPTAPEPWKDDVEAFARELAQRAGDGLGWS